MNTEKTQHEDMVYGDKYHFYHTPNNNSVICTTTYKNQSVRGVAKLDPDDEFVLSNGKHLAYLRCDEKRARKKLNRANKAYEEAAERLLEAKRNLDKAAEFVDDSRWQLEAAVSNLTKFEHELGVQD